MNIVCPNCNAEYLLDSQEKIFNGQKLQCLNCKQKWVQYHFYTKKTETKEKSNNLKKLAHDEYQILEENKKAHDFRAKESDENVQARLQESSDRLKKTKQTLANSASGPSENLAIVDNSVLIGFSIVSFVSILAIGLYVYNDRIQKLFPEKIGLISDYKTLLDRVIRVVQDLIGLGFQIFV